MTIIDVHTHMLDRTYLDRLDAFAAGDYDTGPDAEGRESIRRHGTPFVSLRPQMFDYDLRIKEMDAAGVDVAIVSLTSPNCYWGGEEVSATTARLSNTAMEQAAASHPTRLRYLASLPWQHPALALTELDRAVAAGAVGVMVLANIAGRPLTDPHFAPIWQAIDKLALPVLIHPTTPPGLEDLNVAGHHLVWSVGFPFDTTMAVADLLVSGFFGRYPHLSIIASHGGGTLPYLLPRLDQGFRSFAAARASTDRLPSTLAPRLYVDLVLYAGTSMRFAIDAIGEDNVLFGTDYPHPCGDMEQMIALVDELPSSQRVKACETNPARLFGL